MDNEDQCQNTKSVPTYSEIVRIKPPHNTQILPENKKDAPFQLLLTKKTANLALK